MTHSRDKAKIDESTIEVLKTDMDLILRPLKKEIFALRKMLVRLLEFGDWGQIQPKLNNIVLQQKVSTIDVRELSGSYRFYSKDAKGKPTKELVSKGMHKISDNGIPAIIRVSLFRTSPNYVEFSKSEQKFILHVGIDGAEAVKLKGATMPAPFYLSSLIDKLSLQYFYGEISKVFAQWIRDQTQSRYTQRQIGKHIPGPGTPMQKGKRNYTLQNLQKVKVAVSRNLPVHSPEVMDMAINAIAAIAFTNTKYHSFTFPEIISKAGLEKWAYEGGRKWRASLKKRMEREKLLLRREVNPDGSKGDSPVDWRTRPPKELSLWGPRMSLDQELDPYYSYATNKSPAYDASANIVPGSKEWLKLAMERILKVQKASPQNWHRLTWNEMIKITGIEIPTPHVKMSLIKHLERHNMLGASMGDTAKRMRQWHTQSPKRTQIASFEVKGGRNIRGPQRTGEVVEVPISGGFLRTKLKQSGRYTFDMRFDTEAEGRAIRETVNFIDDSGSRNQIYITGKVGGVEISSNHPDFDFKRR